MHSHTTLLPAELWSALVLNKYECKTSFRIKRTLIRFCCHKRADVNQRS